MKSIMTLGVLGHRMDDESIQQVLSAGIYSLRWIFDGTSIVDVVNHLRVKPPDLLIISSSCAETFRAYLKSLPDGTAVLTADKLRVSIRPT